MHLNRRNLTQSPQRGEAMGEAATKAESGQGATELWRDRIMGFYWSKHSTKNGKLTQTAQRGEARRSRNQSNE